MRDKKIFVSVILITTIMLFICGCGRQAEPVNAEPTETVEKADTEESTEESTGKSTEENAKPAPSPDAALKEGAGSSEVEDNSEREADATEKPVQAEESASAEKPVQNAQTKTEQQSTPAPTPEPQPVHEHVWKEHTAMTQTWIPNIVVVEDYETQYVVVGSHYICSCDFETDDPNAISEHYKEGVRAGTCINFTIWDRYEEQQVLVGTHEEDRGHYETSTYVDYYYCDCGATR